jgi:hypothetical protein
MPKTNAVMREITIPVPMSKKVFGTTSPITCETGRYWE